MKVALLRDQNPDLWGCPFLVDVEQPQMNLSIVFGLCNALMSIACNIDIIFLTAILSLSLDMLHHFFIQCKNSGDSYLDVCSVVPSFHQCFFL